MALVNGQVKASGGGTEWPFVIYHRWNLEWKLASLGWKLFSHRNFHADITLQGEENAGARGRWRDDLRSAANLPVQFLLPLAHKGLIVCRKNNLVWELLWHQQKLGSWMSCAGKEVMDQVQETGQKDTGLSVPVWPSESLFQLFICD